MKLERLGMFSVHGYVDAEPRLGATDTGGQVTYVLELSRALAALGVAVDLYTRGFERRAALAAVCRCGILVEDVRPLAGWRPRRGSRERARAGEHWLRVVRP